MESSLKVALSPNQTTLNEIPLPLQMSLTPNESMTCNLLFSVFVSVCLVSSHRAGPKAPNFAKMKAEIPPRTRNMGAVSLTSIAAQQQYHRRRIFGTSSTTSWRFHRACNGGTPSLQANSHKYRTLQSSIFCRPCISLHENAAPPAFFAKNPRFRTKIEPLPRHGPRKRGQTRVCGAKTTQKRM
jgi:hypothetical protein